MTQQSGSTLFDTAKDAIAATSDFYMEQGGFAYTEEYVTQWLSDHVKLPKSGNVLDICCGDGIWSRGMQILRPDLHYYGVDLADGGVEKARKLLNTDNKHFFAADGEKDLPFADGFFDFIFIRGAGLFNQHSMDRPGAIRVVEDWHRVLKPGKLMLSIYGSIPEKMGSYVPVGDVVLPYNLYPRKTEAVDFEGGKYHHSIESFCMPFWKARNVAVKKYAFMNNLHLLWTTRVEEGTAR